MSEVITGLLGALAALLGVFVNGWLTDRREVARWERERELQKLAWAREDAARSYEHRREAYVNFVTQWRLHYDRAWRYRNEPGPGEPDYDWMDPLHEAFVNVQVFGTKAAVQAAEATMKNLDAYAGSAAKLDYSLFENLQTQIRRDLAIPDASSVSQSKDVAPPA
jgi:hypothetical protein